MKVKVVGLSMSLGEHGRQLCNKAGMHLSFRLQQLCPAACLLRMHPATQQMHVQAVTRSGSSCSSCSTPFGRFGTCAAGAAPTHPLQAACCPPAAAWAETAAVAPHRPLQLAAAAWGKPQEGGLVQGERARPNHPWEAAQRGVRWRQARVAGSASTAGMRGLSWCWPAPASTARQAWQTPHPPLPEWRSAAGPAAAPPSLPC